MCSRRRTSTSNSTSPSSLEIIRISKSRAATVCHSRSLTALVPWRLASSRQVPWRCRTIRPKPRSILSMIRSITWSWSPWIVQWLQFQRHKFNKLVLLSVRHSYLKTQKLRQQNWVVPLPPAKMGHHQIAKLLQIQHRIRRTHFRVNLNPSQKRSPRQPYLSLRSTRSSLKIDVNDIIYFGI